MEIEKLIGKFVVVEYTDSTDQTHRTISVLKGVDESLLVFETPTQHHIFALHPSKILAVTELQKEKIDPYIWREYWRDNSDPGDKNGK